MRVPWDPIPMDNLAYDSHKRLVPKSLRMLTNGYDEKGFGIFLVC